VNNSKLLEALRREREEAAIQIYVESQRALLKQHAIAGFNIAMVSQQKELTEWLATAPADHPMRAAVLAKLAEFDAVAALPTDVGDSISDPDPCEAALEGPVAQICSPPQAVGLDRETEADLERVPQGAFRHPSSANDGVDDPTKAEAIAERAAKRQAVVNPILQRKHWTRGRLVTEAGLGKNSVYQYLDGTRAKITDKNREAIAEALGISKEELPD